MFKFQWLFVFLAFPLPYLIHKYVPKRESRPPSLKVPFFREVNDREFAVSAPSKTMVGLAALVWFTLLCAVARPLWIEENVQVPVTGRDLLIALDISGSMQQQDFSAGNRSRFSAVQEIASEFVARRAGDRVGLILFGSQPYLYTPLTFDLDS
ncbi:MAG: VWA domain-containing protein, partial [Gammaproteobacteria bacterium]|nr:VWA domain-containing protein [Gammaproteobacteria bacterium]